ncbi:phosphatidate cytidylyltransferase [Ramlibacter sp. AW1]|uniref:Phosphatidate cytidylyltransferase n=1 Tax=Ramlibacter aurantiacus TaxID=2801330 RepID=A0A936ZQ09_9BURK|nr:phosphatidate cytidylyltransferase [Ramlibacter aurantiacus]MBL0420371.1 phosphatidate cytidylyltransferase [Ramlibacter aurantiacus]
MLKQRIITALVLLAILLPALFWPSPQPFIAVVLVLVAAGTWEFARLNGFGPGASITAGGACVLLCALAWWLGLPYQRLPLLWLAVGALWVLGAGLLLRRGVPGWPLLPRPLRLAGGMSVLVLAWLAAAQARAIGINFLLSILVLVWVADVAAYFAGRAFGLKIASVRLAPTISPGKSWEGVWGGMVAVLLLAVAWSWADLSAGSAVPSLYASLAHRSWVLLVVGTLFLVSMSVAGDLLESLVKRSAGAKDSSQLLPGHGGVLDRVDALLPALPLAMMLVSI